MAKDPAFLFYPQDFLTGTMFFSNEEIGIYIRLLCAQHQHGGLINKTIFNSLVPAESIIRTKFLESEEGYFNERLMNEIIKRTKKSDNLSANAKQMWSKRKANVMQLESKCNAIASGLHMPIENENEDVNETKDYNEVLLNKIIDYGQAKEIPKEICELYFHHYEKKNWIDGNGIKITNWKSGLINWNKKQITVEKKPEQKRQEPQMSEDLQKIKNKILEKKNAKN